MPVTTTTASPPDSGFIPRKEFIRDQQNQPSAFALLALSSSNFIRLYSFQTSVVAGIKRLFEQQNIAFVCREDTNHNLYEYSIDGKPWANPKAPATEKLLVEIVSLVYQTGYTFLSTIDYGREPDDRIAMVFSRPAVAPAASRTGTPLPSGGSPFLGSSHSSFLEKSRSRKVPFAISFSSTTVMRVISPPLHLTPAILQAVRASWPRGVVSEKALGENSYEFKLKGYKWFQQDNFALDSLHHILSLLSSLDAQSFTLLTSLSLNNRSRVKDLWIFTGPGPVGGDESPLGSSQDQPIQNIQESGGINSTAAQPSGMSRGMHRRAPTEPAVPSPQLASTSHQRATSEDISPRPPQSQSSPPHLLRKPAPRAQVPVSVIQEGDIEPEPDYSQEGYVQRRANLPSTISSSVDNMTGIGAIGQFRSETGIPGPTPPFSPPLQTVSEHHRTPLPSNVGPSPRAERRGSRSHSKGSSKGSAENGGNTSAPTTPPALLSGNPFRDTGVPGDNEMGWSAVSSSASPHGSDDSSPRLVPQGRLLSNPKIPGGWQSTPVEEKQEGDSGASIRAEHAKQSQTPIYELHSRVEAPEIIHPDVPLRKSEAALVGIIAATTSPSPVETPPSSSSSHQRDPVPAKVPDKPPKASTSGGKGGWVLVNVESSSAVPKAGESSSKSPLTQDPKVTPTPNPVDVPSPDSSKSPVSESTTAKAIVIMDALDANSKQKKPRAPGINKESGEGGSVRRFFSLSKKHSRKSLEERKDDTTKTRERTLSDSISTPTNPTTTIPRSTFRDRLRRFGTPQAMRSEDKRKSID